MAKYRVLGATPDTAGLIELPDDAQIIGALYHPMTGELNVVLLQKVLSPKTAGKTEVKVIRLPVHPEKKTTKEA